MEHRYAAGSAQEWANRARDNRFDLMEPDWWCGPIVVGNCSSHWIWGDQDMDAVNSVAPCGVAGAGTGASMPDGTREPGRDEADWPKETEDADEERSFVLEFFLDGVCLECRFPPVHP